MKSILLFFVLLLFKNVFAQIDKGTWVGGGCGNMYSYNDNYTAPSVNGTAKYTSLDVSASIDYFLFDKYSGGLQPYFSSFKGESSGGGTTNSYRLAIGPVARPTYGYSRTGRNFIY
ncbi:MAG: hypothetical protein Q8K64_13450 [Sediminibacterium sp.]|nr:hypothetical protein [Sediminibacterium sp.]